MYEKRLVSIWFKYKEKNFKECASILILYWHLLCCKCSKSRNKPEQFNRSIPTLFFSKILYRCADVSAWILKLSHKNMADVMTCHVQTGLGEVNIVLKTVISHSIIYYIKMVAVLLALGRPRSIGFSFDSDKFSCFQNQRVLL